MRIQRTCPFQSILQNNVEGVLALVQNLAQSRSVEVAILRRNFAAGVFRGAGRLIGGGQLLTRLLYHASTIVNYIKVSH